MNIFLCTAFPWGNDRDAVITSVRPTCTMCVNYWGEDPYHSSHAKQRKTRNILLKLLFPLYNLYILIGILSGKPSIVTFLIHYSVKFQYKIINLIQIIPSITNTGIPTLFGQISVKNYWFNTIHSITNTGIPTNHYRIPLFFSQTNIWTEGKEGMAAVDVLHRQAHRHLKTQYSKS